MHYVLLYSGYGIVWTLRCLVLRRIHLRDVAAGNLPAGECMTALRYHRNDEVSLLDRGFSDQSGEVAWMARACGGVNTVATLCRVLRYCYPIQCLCMDLCLAKAVYRCFTYSNPQETETELN